MSRTTRGPRVWIVSRGCTPCSSAVSRIDRVTSRRRSIGWYGSVALDMYTASPDGSSPERHAFAISAAAFRFTETQVPQASCFSTVGAKLRA